MRLHILQVSSENVDDGYIPKMEIFSGKAAGVCYLKGNYFTSNASVPDKAAARFDMIIPTGHHSIADHSYITILFEDIPKMTAMVLNSVGLYNTSEKSGRYTVMSSEEQALSINESLYYKWKEKFKELITKYDNNLAEKEPKLLEKLSMENARYVLSMFALIPLWYILHHLECGVI